MQLGNEAANRGQSEEVYAKNKAKEERMKDQLDKLKEQVSKLENKWEIADVQHSTAIGVSEERKSRNQLSEHWTKLIYYFILLIM